MSKKELKYVTPITEKEEQMEIQQNLIKLYARENENGVCRFLNTIFNKEEILETDIFLGEGSGDAHAHPQTIYQLYDFEGLHNFKIADGKMQERTEEEKEQEKAKRPAPPIEPITRIERELTNMDIQNIVAEQMLTDLDIRIMELEVEK